ncbi:L-rhamnose/proton symporter RhaT [Haloferula sargassicola]|uniref:L-rhamnose/proton symporter RhaT n=1 Tax=Haloferula sargassicola TaxID=490096 RepID=UPI00336588B9
MSPAPLCREPARVLDRYPPPAACHGRDLLPQARGNARFHWIRGRCTRDLPPRLRGCRQGRPPGRPGLPLLRNYTFAALAGLTWYLQFFFYTMGEAQMGDPRFSSWALHMA